MSRFEVQIRDTAGKQSFRSIHFGKELEEVSFRQGKFVFPASEGEPFTFDISASAPFRQNKGDKTGEPIAQLTISGTAVPMPKWVMY
jgi:hypothetical protein